MTISPCIWALGGTLVNSLPAAICILSFRFCRNQREFTIVFHWLRSPPCSTTNLSEAREKREVVASGTWTWIPHILTWALERKEKKRKWVPKYEWIWAIRLKISFLSRAQYKRHLPEPWTFSLKRQNLYYHKKPFCSCIKRKDDSCWRENGFILMIIVLSFLKFFTGFSMPGSPNKKPYAGLYESWNFSYLFPFLFIQLIFSWVCWMKRKDKEQIRTKSL